MLKGANVKKSLDVRKDVTPLKLILSNKVNPTFTPHFQQVKTTATPPSTKLSFVERWKRFLADHDTYQILARAQSAVDASGKLLSKIRVKDSNNTRYAIYRERLSKGGSGRVNIAQNLTTYAFCILKRSTDGDEKAAEEAAILKKLNLFEGLAFKTRKDATQVSYLFMKILPGVTLHDFKKLCKTHEQTLSLKEQAQLLLSTLQAMQQLIQQCINHGDVHDKNVLFDPLTWETHFIDFGDSSIVPNNGSKNHHQHYDIRKLLQALNGLVTDSALLSITTQYLYSWTGLESKLQSAIDSVRILAAAPESENPTPEGNPTPTLSVLKR